MQSLRKLTSSTIVIKRNRESFSATHQVVQFLGQFLQGTQARDLLRLSDSDNVTLGSIQNLLAKRKRGEFTADLFQKLAGSESRIPNVNIYEHIRFPVGLLHPSRNRKISAHYTRGQDRLLKLPHSQETLSPDYVINHSPFQ